MKRRIVSLLLALVLAFGLSTAASAYTDEQYRSADALNHLDLFRGRSAEGKDYDLDGGLNRAEGTLMVIRLLGKETEAYTRDTKNTPFTDVADFWGGKTQFIAYAYETNLVRGMKDTEFGPAMPMNDQMFLTLILRVLGYPDQDNNIWNNAYTLAVQAGLVDKAEKDADFTRGDAALVAWKALGAKLYGATGTLADKLMGERLFTDVLYGEAKEIWAYGAVLDDYEGPSAPVIPQQPEIPAEPVVPETPEEPVVPEIPAEPAVPETPEEPVVPEIPAEPVVPETPEEPVVPETPEEPVVPETPEEPVVPETPEEPVVPETPEGPVVPETPEEPVVPETPEEPVVPEAPDEPVIPETPEEPVVPETPEEPVVPETPENPEQPEEAEKGEGASPDWSGEIDGGIV